MGGAEQNREFRANVPAGMEIATSSQPTLFSCTCLHIM